MADFFIDNLVRKSIVEIIENRDTLPDIKNIWKSQTRMMFKHYSSDEVFGWIFVCLSESADEEWLEKKYPKNFFNEDWVYPKRKSVIKINLQKSRIKKLINDNLKITEVAKSYGLIIKKGKTVCPFHLDTDPSLSFSDEKNVFNCFGCSAKGDVVTFIKKMEDIKENVIKRTSRI